MYVTERDGSAGKLCKDFWCIDVCRLVEDGDCLPVSLCIWISTDREREVFVFPSSVGRWGPQNQKSPTHRERGLPTSG